MTVDYKVEEKDCFQIAERYNVSWKLTLGWEYNES